MQRTFYVYFINNTIEETISEEGDPISFLQHLPPISREKLTFMSTIFLFFNVLIRVLIYVWFKYLYICEVPTVCGFNVVSRGISGVFKHVYVD